MPVTRSIAKSSSSSVHGAPAQRSDLPPTVKGEASQAPTLSIFEGLQDDSPLRGREVKMLRDATSSAITQVWSDTCSTAALLTQKINEGNAALTAKLNESFAAVGKRLDALPTVAMFHPDSQPSRLAPFSGTTENGVQFSVWLRRLEDVIRMRPVPLSDEQKAYFLVGHLDGVAREKVEELDASARQSYASIVSHLTAFFEIPQQRYVARQKLSSCRQEPGESCTAFANRILNLVRAATSGQDHSTQQDRVLEEFVASLRGDIRYFVKLDNPVSFDQAVAKAQTVEQLLSEATAERLLYLASAIPSPAPIQLLARPIRESGYRRNPPRGRSGNPSRGRFSAQSSIQQRGRSAAIPTRTMSSSLCFNCGGRGHYASDCPSEHPRLIPRGSARTESYPRAARRGREGEEFSSGRPRANLIAPDRGPPDMDATIAQLSDSLQSTQLQLQNSQARVAALIDRNKQLTRLSLASPPRAHDTSSILPDVRLLFCVLVGLLSVVSPGAAIDAWICPHQRPTNLFRWSDTQNCSQLLPNLTAPSYGMSLRIYRPNTQLYSYSAFLCKIVRHSVTYSVKLRRSQGTPCRDPYRRLRGGMQANGPPPSVYAWRS